MDREVVKVTQQEVRQAARKAIRAVREFEACVMEYGEDVEYQGAALFAERQTRQAITQVEGLLIGLLRSVDHSLPAA